MYAQVSQVAEPCRAAPLGRPRAWAVPGRSEPRLRAEPTRDVDDIGEIASSPVGWVNNRSADDGSDTCKHRVARMVNSGWAKEAAYPGEMDKALAGAIDAGSGRQTCSSRGLPADVQTQQTRCILNPQSCQERARPQRSGNRRGHWRYVTATSFHLGIGRQVEAQGGPPQGGNH